MAMGHELPVITQLFDISLPIAPAMHTMPGNAATTIHDDQRRARGDVANLSSLHISLHAGTHIDAPLHMHDGQPGIDGLPLARVVGPVWVAAILDVELVTRTDLEGAGIPEGVTRLLLKTRNSDHLRDDVPYVPDYVGLENDGAGWVVERGIAVVGIDYLGIEPPGREVPTTHHILMDAGVTIIEGLDLELIEPGPYLLLCLPLSIVDGDGSPVRIALAR